MTAAPARPGAPVEATSGVTQLAQHGQPPPAASGAVACPCPGATVAGAPFALPPVFVTSAWLGTEQESTAGHFTPGAIEGSYVVATKKCRTITSIHKKGGLQLEATMRTTREGPQTGTHKAAVPRGHKEEADGGQGGGRYRKRAAAEAAAVTQSEGGSAGGRCMKRGGGSEGGRYRIGRLSWRPLQEAGSRHRRPLRKAGGRHRRPLRKAGGRCRRPLQSNALGQGIAA
jgi:hypothetical protein